MDDGSDMVDESGIPDPPAAVTLQPLGDAPLPPVEGLTLVGRLGTGGMADAFLARQGAVRWAVVKSPRPPVTGDVRSRLSREVEAMRRIHSPLVAAVLASRLEGDRPWFATEYVPGPTLTDFVIANGPLDSVQLDALARGLAECVAAVHRSDVIHRDLKPDNVVLSPDGPRLIDFGTADLPDATSLTMVGQVVGTLTWMAPEQISGEEVTPAVDVHAWGLLLTYAASGIAPFDAATPVATMYRALHEEPTLPDSVGLPTRDLILRAVSKDRARRPAIEEILAALGSGPTGPTGAAPGPPAVAAAAAAAGAGALGGASAMAAGSHAVAASAGGGEVPAGGGAPPAPPPHEPEPGRSPGTRWGMVLLGLAVAVVALVAGIALANSRDDTPADVTPSQSEATTPPSPTPSAATTAPPTRRATPTRQPATAPTAGSTPATPPEASQDPTDGPTEAPSTDPPSTPTPEPTDGSAPSADPPSDAAAQDPAPGDAADGAAADPDIGDAPIASIAGITLGPAASGSKPSRWTA